MRILVTGGCGYVGSVLVPKLVAAGHEVTAIDIGWFGCNLPHHQNLLANCSHDFRDGYLLSPFDAIIHLAAIANDPTGDLDPVLTWKTNAFGTMDLAERAAAAGVKQFIYASSGSVYGVSEQPCAEDAPCVPLSAYNETKKVAERALLSYADRMAVQIVRPGTVCGVSPRQRLDVLVNALVAEARREGRLTLREPQAMRPHIHIEDMCAVYLWMLEHPEATGIWNAGFENLNVRQVAGLVAGKWGGEIVEQVGADKRSYWMDSSKLLRAGFEPRHSVWEAVKEVGYALIDGRIVDDDRAYNMRVMKALYAR